MGVNIPVFPLSAIEEVCRLAEPESLHLLVFESKSFTFDQIFDTLNYAFYNDNRMSTTVPAFQRHCRAVNGSAFRGSLVESHNLSGREIYSTLLHSIPFQILSRPFIILNPMK